MRLSPLPAFALLSLLTLCAAACDDDGTPGADAALDQSAGDSLTPGRDGPHGDSAATDQGAGDAAIASDTTSGPVSYQLIYSTFLGGSAFDRNAGDQFTDAQGNLYLAGNTQSADFPVTSGAYDTSHNGNSDGFVAKLSPSGTLLWATFLGGPYRDELYGVEVDSAGYVYVAGAFSSGAPTTPGVVQPTFAGGDGSTSGGVDWDGYIAKLEPDGSDLVWATYLGHASSNDNLRSMSLDASNNVVVTTGAKAGSPWPAAWFTGSFQSTMKGGDDSLVIKVKADGSQVLWATYLGGSADEMRQPAVKLDAQGNVYVLTWTKSTDIPTTAGAYDKTHNGGSDAFLARLSADGKTQLAGTYLGTADKDGTGGKSPITVDNKGNAVLAVWTKSTSFPTTAGAAHPAAVEMESWGATSVVVKVSPSGALLASSYMGHRGSSEAVSVDASDNIYTVGTTSISGQPVTQGALQKTYGGGDDTYVEVFDSGLSSVIYGTYHGGSGDEGARMCWFDKANGALYVTGNTNGVSFPLHNAWQSTFGGNGDIFVVKLKQ